MNLSKSKKQIVILLLCLLLLFLPYTIRSQHLIHILIFAGIESIVVIGFVAQYHVRLLSFCTSTFMGIGAYISGVLSTMFGLEFWFCLPLAGIATGLFGFVLGQLIIRTGWVTFLMLSIVIAQVFEELVGHIQLLGGWDGMVGIIPPSFGSIVLGTKICFYYLTLGLVLFCALVFLAFYTSAIGKAWKAMGQSTDLAASIGINLFKYRMIVYVTSCFTAGLSGSLYAHYSGYIVPQTFGLVRSLFIPINAAVGGVNFLISGPITGAAVLKMVPELLRITDRYEQIFEGAVILLCALFFPTGIMGILRGKVKRGL